MIGEVDVIPMAEEDEGDMIGFGKYIHVEISYTMGILKFKIPLFNKIK